MNARSLAVVDFPDRSYIACEDMEFGWDPADVDLVAEWWREGMSYDAMADGLDRDADEVAILLIDLVRSGRIEKRKRGCRG